MNTKHSTRLISCIKHCLVLCGLLVLLGGGQQALAQRPFITTWKTDNSGASGGNQIIISGTGSNYTITWQQVSNPNNTQTIMASNRVTLTLPAVGIYKVSISGNFHRIMFNSDDDPKKLISIEQWGDIVWSSMANAFSGCQNMTYNATDNPNLSNVTDMGWMFNGCSNFNGAIGNWNTSNVTNMRYLFYKASAFNQPIGNWNTSNVTNMTGVFWEASAFNQPIDNWNTSNVTDMSLMFSEATMFNQPIGNWNTNNVTDMSHMFNKANAFNQPIGNWNTSNVTDMRAMFFRAVAFNQPIGNWNTSNVTNMRHMFANATMFNQPIGNWNTSNVTNMNNMFAWASIFNQPIDNWNTGNVTDMNNMFRQVQTFNQPIGNWDVSQVTDMGWMFSEASAFNQPIGNWNTGNVTNMGRMFNEAVAFNQPIGNWNTSNVTNMSNMFRQAQAFNQPLNNWNTGNVTNMYGMFYRASAFNGTTISWNTGSVTNMSYMFYWASAFNQPIGNWSTGSVTNMSYMFNEAETFNQPIGNWNTSNVTDMSYMFYRGVAFNQPIGNWNTSNVTNMNNMFANATMFNQPIGNWSTGNVTNMRSMFLWANAFNQPLNNWNTSNVTNMKYTFYQASAFNQPIGNWNTSNVADMSYMFYKAGAFDQSLGSWNITQVTDITNMLYQCGMEVQNYDQTLIGWASQSVPNDLSLGARDLRYCKAVNARAILTNQRNWTITGDQYSPCSEINLQYNGADIDSGESVDLGNINVGSASAYQTFTIENTGDANLVLSGTPKVQLQGLHPNDFTVIQHQLNSPVAPNTSQTFEVRFNPTQIGIRQVSLVIYNDDHDENPYTIHLIGEALGVPDIYISQNGVEKPSGSVFNFGVAGILHPSAPFEFVVHNMGNSNLVLQNGNNSFVTISGAHAKDFRVTKISSNSVLAPGQSANFVVQLFPSATGIRQATLTIQSNDPDENPYIIYLEGASILDAIEDPKLQVSPNPTSDKLTLNTTQWQGEAININIRSEQGRVMMSQDIARAKDKLTFEVANYKTGWYVLVVSTKKGKYSYKFMKK